ncbi:helix-turn-helix domain-containing protein [Roseateles sp. SL47]|uniref:helix-turn-helix domain-containing protein n=1 Tax=Roseateles sp. SL47 TaxID=2995138 RepID=UPI00226DCA64|nr:helix-turn-helix domain-containing protein [Roseateles sp. SL47]WAC71508.1 helix-turn-helix domain-containing protein [Roseateles sp. SL47]
MNTIPEVSAELRRVLKQSGRTGQSLREAAGLSRQTFSNVMGGTSDFKLSTLLALADRLGLELLLLPKGAARGLQSSDATPPVVETVVDLARKRAAGPGGQGQEP